MVMTWVPGFAREDATGWMWISRIGSILGLRGCTRGRKNGSCSGGYGRQTLHLAVLGILPIKSHLQ